MGSPAIRCLASPTIAEAPLACSAKQAGLSHSPCTNTNLSSWRLEYEDLQPQDTGRKVFTRHSHLDKCGWLSKGAVHAFLLVGLLVVLILLTRDMRQGEAKPSPHEVGIHHRRIEPEHLVSRICTSSTITLRPNLFNAGTRTRKAGPPSPRRCAAGSGTQFSKCSNQNKHSPQEF